MPCICMLKCVAACLHMYGHTCVGVYVHRVLMHVETEERLMRDHSSTSSNGAESLSQPQRPLAWLVSLTSLLGGFSASVFWG